MAFDWSTLALQTVNFAVLAWLLQRFLYAPVLRLIEARRADVERRYADAGAAGVEAEARLRRLANEREQAVKQAAAEAERFAQERRAKAEREAGTLVEAARRTIAEERAHARA